MKLAESHLRPCGESEQALLRSRRTVPSRGEESWRVLRIQSEIVDGFETLRSVRPSVCVFGSARTTHDQPMYELARRTGALVAERGSGVITGGVISRVDIDMFERVDDPAQVLDRVNAFAVDNDLVPAGPS